MSGVVHILDPDAFVRSAKEWPWCGHGFHVPVVEHPDDATCKHCLRRYARWELQQARQLVAAADSEVRP